MTTRPKTVWIVEGVHPHNPGPRNHVHVSKAGAEANALSMATIIWTDTRSLLKEIGEPVPEKPTAETWSQVVAAIRTAGCKAFDWEDMRVEVWQQDLED